MDLRGQRIVVIGGTSGIGLATAIAAAAEGADTTVVSRNQASVDRALKRLPGDAHGHAVDITDPAAVDALFDTIGDIDHLVYTAGDPLALMSVADLDIDRARAFFDVRYLGTLSAVRAATPHLRPGGSITLTTGAAKDRPAPGWSVAASVCGAIESLTRALAVELAPVRVNAVSPGVVRSPLWDTMSEQDRERFYRDQAASLPVGRVGETDDIAAAYLFFLAQPYTTGAVLTIDGGGVLV